MDQFVTAATAALLTGLAKEAGGSAWAGAKRVLALVRGKLAGDRSGEAALARVEAGDETARRELEAALDDHASRDAAFRDELARLLAEARREPAVARFLTNVSGNARVDKITNIETVHGDVSF